MVPNLILCLVQSRNHKCAFKFPNTPLQIRNWESAETVRLIQTRQKSTDIQGGSHIPYIAPWNGVVSNGAQIEGHQVFADHTCKNKCVTISACHVPCLHIDLHAQTAPDKPQLFWLQKNQRPPIWTLSCELLFHPKYEWSKKFKNASILNSICSFLSQRPHKNTHTNKQTHKQTNCWKAWMNYTW